MGIVVGGFGGGALVFNQIQTALVNLENYQVDKSFIPFEQEKLYALCWINWINKGFFLKKNIFDNISFILFLLFPTHLIGSLYVSWRDLINF